jgi:hypothetical protein
MTRVYAAYIARVYRARISPIPPRDIRAPQRPQLAQLGATQISARRKAGGKMRVSGSLEEMRA